MGVLQEKLKEVIISVLPIVGIVLLLTIVFAVAGKPLPPVLLLGFLLGALLIAAGLTLFLLGVDRGVSPLGEHIGVALSKSGRVWFIALVGLIAGFFVSVAEPDLQILAGQVSAVTSGAIGRFALLAVVSLGVAVMLVIGLFRIFYNIPLYQTLLLLYGLILLLSLFSPPEFLAISFDASGATTGALTVPFVLALALGIAHLKRDSKASEKDSFGLVGVTSTGAIISVLLMGLLSHIQGLNGSLPEAESGKGMEMVLRIAGDSLTAIFPLFIIFAVFQTAVFKFPKRERRRILLGLIYTWLGLILFLTGVNAGFMELGVELGKIIAQFDRQGWIVAVGFLLGFATILAEPAVYILTRQIETVTAGYIKRRVVLGALAIGVGAAVGLSMLRIIVPEIQLWHYLLPGFGLCILLSFITPKLFVGIAFDSGGVASGPMTATFILSFSQGVAESVPSADILRDSFGMIAMVAMTPIIALEILGVLFKIRSHHKGGVRTRETNKANGAG
ncbi:MAG: DUF1538 domain-containing protein [Clostridiales bacterium]|nr:DUF1538 domain-containing protein [Clostridiales bacterium]